MAADPLVARYGKDGVNSSAAQNTAVTMEKQQATALASVGKKTTDVTYSYTVALNNFANGALLQNYGSSMAGALLASAPTRLVYILLGRYFIGGLMSGSVKG